MNRPVGKIAFVSPHCAIDFTNGAATATLDALVFLQSLGYSCQIFCSSRSDSWEEDNIEKVLAERAMPCLARDARIGRHRGRMIFTAYRSAGAPRSNGTSPLACASGLDARAIAAGGSSNGGREAIRSSPLIAHPSSLVASRPHSPLAGASGFNHGASLAGPSGCDASRDPCTDNKPLSPRLSPGGRGEHLPVTLFHSASSRGWRDREEIAAFLTAAEIFLRANRPDLVWTYGGDPVSRHLHRIVRQLEIPLLFELHNFAYLDHSMFAATDHVIVPTEFARRFYQEKLGLESEVLPLVVDAERVCVRQGAGSEEQGANRPHPSPLPEGEGTFVTFVNPTPLKGVHVFARIAEELSKLRPDISLLLVEGSSKVKFLPQWGIDLAGLKNLTIWPNTPDARKFYAVSKLLLMPSLMENAGFIAMEAMTNGIPVLASSRGGLPETIGTRPHPSLLPEGEGTGGFLFDIPARYTPETRDVPTAEEVAPWIEAIVRLWDDAEAYNRATVAARDRAKCWHPERLAPLYREFFRQSFARRCR
jgi:glycosyltransferase involved in cell wall biosynthesis